MLVLTRMIDETVVLLDAEGRLIAEVVVVAFRPGQVRLGITAAPQVRILRAEVERAEQLVREGRGDEPVRLA